MPDEIDKIRSEKITIHFDGKRCVHSRHCVLGNPEVFVPNAPGQWIHPEATTVEEVVALAAACPSGAITYARHDGGPPETAPKVNVVRIRENGPLAFHAELDIAGHGKVYRAALCRCGASGNKPFCDGSHAGHENAAKFVATGEPATLETPPLARQDGPLTVTPKLNGPLYVKGNLEICAGTGRAVQRCTEAWLCRCGQSANKPFCDGTHRKIGFRAPGVKT